MEGMLTYEGKVIKPPFRVTQTADRVYVNNVQIFPPPEVEESFELATLGIEDKFSMEEKKSNLDMFGEIERVMDEFNSASSENWAEYRDITFEEKSEMIIDFLQRKGYKPKLSSEYRDVLVPITEDYGVMVHFNEEARIQMMREDHTQSDATLDFDVAKDLVEYIESNLALGHFLRFEKNIIELIPAEQVDTIINDLERIDNVSWRDIEYDEKVAKIVDKIIVVPKKIACSAAIFFPHRSWQKEVVGTASSYWSTLSQKLVAEGYWVKTYLDKTVTLNVWADILAKGSAQNLRVIYNQGHGGGDEIVVGSPHLKGDWHYFTSNFVKKYAKLNKTIVYIHSCATMSNNKLATAFCDKGACAYLGWKHNTSANAAYCDKIDTLFWEPMIDLHSTAIYAKKKVATIDNDLKGSGNRFCRIPIKKWNC